MIEIALEICSLVLIPLTVFNAIWSFSGLCNMLRNQVHPSSIYRTVIFFASAGLLGKSIGALMLVDAAATGAFTLLVNLLALLAMIFALVGNMTNSAARFDKFFWLFRGDNLNVATRAASLNEFDPDLVQKVLSKCERKLVKKIVED